MTSVRYAKVSTSAMPGSCTDRSVQAGQERRMRSRAAVTRSRKVRSSRSGTGSVTMASSSVGRAEVGQGGVGHGVAGRVGRAGTGCEVDGERHGAHGQAGPDPVVEADQQP